MVCVVSHLLGEGKVPSDQAPLAAAEGEAGESRPMREERVAEGERGEAGLKE